MFEICVSPSESPEKGHADYLRGRKRDHRGSRGEWMPELSPTGAEIKSILELGMEEVFQLL